MPSDQHQPAEEPKADSLNLIRVETALSRYPIHRLSNNGTVDISIRKNDAHGTAQLVWEIDYGSRHGQPGPLAYKLDTLIINRRIEEAGRPVPKLLRLGSLSEIARELDIGNNTPLVRKALAQNFGVTINAKMTYKGVDKTEQTLEALFYRYNVIYTGEKLPNGHKADAVYLLFNDIYLDVLNKALRRPLDYDYLKELSPSAQRFYEIISYEMLPAVKFNQRAKLPYSEFCLYSTMTRYHEFDHVKKQMYKVHRSHIASGYIGSKIEYEATVDDDGKPDWNMYYIPGEKARFQHLVFSFQLPAVAKERPSLPPPAKKEKSSDPQPMLPMAIDPLPPSEPRDLVKKFYHLRYGHVQEPVERELEEADGYLKEGSVWAEYLIGYAAKHGKEIGGFPNDFGGVKKLVGQAREPYDTRRKEREASAAKKARESHEKAHMGAYYAFLGELLAGKLEATFPKVYATFIDEETSTYQFHKGKAIKSTTAADIVKVFYEEDMRIRRLITFIRHNPKSGIPGFWLWDEKLNPNGFRASASK